MQLYKLSALITLERQSTNFSGQSKELDSWVKTAFQLMQQLPELEQPFPLFIVGCEARSDEDRSVVLELMARTKLMEKSANLQFLAHIMKSVWVQDDLAEEIIDYGLKQRSIFGAMNMVPSFA